MKASGRGGRFLLERLAPLTSGLGALAGGILDALVIFRSGIPPNYLYSRLDYLTATVLSFGIMAVIPGLLAFVACTCTHNGRLAVPARLRAFGGAFAGSLLLSPGWFLLGPLLAGFAVHYYHRLLAVEAAGEISKTARLPTAPRYLVGYLTSLAVLGLLVFSQSIRVSGRGSIFLLYGLPGGIALYLIGSYFLLRAVERHPDLRGSYLAFGLICHGPLLLFVFSFAVFYALAQVLRLDFVLRDPYTQQTVVDYTLAADPILGLWILFFFVGFVRALFGTPRQAGSTRL